MDPLRYLIRSTHEHTARLGRAPDALRDLMEERARENTGGMVSLGVLPVSGERADTPVLLTPDEACGQHGLVAGATGSGKTMLALTWAEALARAGAIVVLVSPHPDLIAGGRALAARLGRPLVALDFGGRGPVVTPFSLFPRSVGRPDELAHLVTSLFCTSFGGGQAAGMIRGALLPLFVVLAANPERLTLLDADRLVHDPAFAAPFVNALETPLPSVVHFYESLRGKGRAAAVHGARYGLARLHALTAYRGARLTLCARPVVDLRQVLRTPCVVTVDVPAATLGEASGLLAGLVVEQLRQVLMQRSVPTREPHVAVFVDELGSLAHVEHLGAFLAQARKWRASLIGLAQSTSQLESGSKLLDAFLTNAGMLALGRLGGPDARRFAAVASSLPQPTKLQAEGSWLEGRDLSLRRPDEARTLLNEAEAVNRLTNLPTRTFCVRLAVESQVHVGLMRAHDVDWVNEVARPTLLGVRPAQEVEDEIQTRLREASAAGPEPQRPATSRRITRSGSPRTEETATPLLPPTDQLPPIKPNLKNRI